MDSYTKGQRWISETEPELGLGTIIQVQDDRVQILFSASGEVRTYAIEHAPIRRVRYRIGDTVRTVDKHTLVVKDMVETDGLITYYGDGIEVPEAMLSDTLSFNGAEDRLLSGHFDEPGDFELRRRTLAYHHHRSKSPVRGFLGGRIDLIPHQLYIAHEVSSRYAPRVLLADEVGLGKTIEACLILHRMLLSGRARRVLVLVPESLVHQWFVEMLRRFNLWFHIFDEERCAALEAGDPNANPFFDDQLVLSSIQFLEGNPKRTRQALAAQWDMLVVDEAHHLEWSPDNISSGYALVEQLSRDVEGLLLLTATPEQLGQESHFARLRLLDPDRYSDFEAFKSSAGAYKEIADLVERLSEGKKLSTRDIEFLKTRFNHDHRIESRLTSINDGDEADRNRLIEDILDLHGPGRVQFRNTRAAMSGFPKRNAHFVVLESEQQQLERIAAEFAHDIGDAMQTSFDYADDPRLKGLVTLLRQLDPHKVLLICSSKQKAIALEEALRRRINIKAGVFHEDMTLVQRDRNAAWFAEKDGARLLICSEIGSEGRNFQFAHHLVLFDLPLNPELLAQRIGRLDRIGQDEDIHIYIPYVSGSPQEVLCRWYHDGLNAFESSQEGGQELLRMFGPKVRALARYYLKLESEEALKRLDRLLKETARARKALTQKLEQGRDRLLERNSFRPDVAHQLVEAIQVEDRDPRLEAYMLEIFDAFGVPFEDIVPHTYRITGQSTNTGAFPALPDDGMVITFDRKRALRREDIGFMSWDHPMVTGAMDLVMGSEKGNSSFAVLIGTNEHRLMLEVQLVLETVAEAHLHVDRFLPPTPLRILVNQHAEDVTDQYPVSALRRRLKKGNPDVFFEHPDDFRSLIQHLIKTATDVAERKAQSVIEERLALMHQLLDHEIDRLRMLQSANGHVRDQEIELAVRQKQKLDQAIEQARVRVDSLRLIAGS